MSVIYNEIDPKPAAWLRALVDAGELPEGHVDERSIADFDAGDLGAGSFHAFAGIGGWPYALRLAGWPDDKPVWTGSCPCPPFSAAGKGSECPSCGGKRALAHPLVTAGWVCLDCGDEWSGDDRHLVPEFIRLVAVHRPPVVFGEQVASAAGRVWVSALRAVLEKLGYAVGAADLCAAGIGAPHIRQRLFFGAVRVADAEDAGLEGRDGKHADPKRREETSRPSRSRGVAGGLADADGGNASPEREQRGREHGQQPENGGARRLADAVRTGWAEGRACAGHGQAAGSGADLRPGPADSPWRDADWLHCRDGKWRPTQSGIQPLADGVPARVGRLRGYGNAIVPQLAAAFVLSFMEAVEGLRCRPG